MRPISGDTKMVGLLGGRKQVLSSLSPPIHNAAFEALELNWVYVPLPHEGSNVSAALNGLAESGFRGLNVTMPLKLAVAEVADRLVGVAAEIGAVNTVVFDNGGATGYNTDGPGLMEFLSKDVGFEPRGCQAMVIGAGGAARAVVASLVNRGAKVLVVARDAEKAKHFERSDAGGSSTKTLGEIGPTDVAAADLIINATPVGQQNKEQPIPLDGLRSESVIVDLIYSPPSTALIEQARSMGAVAHNGLGLLLHQAALSFELWTGVKPPMEKMSPAALAAVASRKAR